MNTEKSIYNGDDATKLDETMEMRRQQETLPTGDGAASEKTQNGTWRKVAVGTGMGIAFGAGSTLLTGAVIANAPHEVDAASASESASDDIDRFIVDNDVAVSTSVNDDMTFSQAFAAARAEVGPGGVFEWHGNLYGTYYAEEWDRMSPEERAAYNNHFSWASHDSQAASRGGAAASASGEAEVVGHDSVQEGEVLAAANGEEADAPAPSEPEVEVLGVYHDKESGANIGGVLVDGQGVVLIDVDGDHTFDGYAADFNHDGVLSPNEFRGIPDDQSLTVEDLGGFTDPEDNLYANNDDFDYSHDPLV